VKLPTLWARSFTGIIFFLLYLTDFEIMKGRKKKIIKYRDTPINRTREH